MGTAKEIRELLAQPIVWRGWAAWGEPWAQEYIHAWQTEDGRRFMEQVGRGQRTTPSEADTEAAIGRWRVGLLRYAERLSEMEADARERTNRVPAADNLEIIATAIRDGRLTDYTLSYVGDDRVTFSAVLGGIAVTPPQSSPAQGPARPGSIPT